MLVVKKIFPGEFFTRIICCISFCSAKNHEFFRCERVLVCILYPAAFLQSNVGGQSHSKAHCRTSQLRFTLFLSSVRVPPESRPSTLGFGDSSISIVNVGGLRCMCNTIWKKKLLFELA